MRFTGYSFGSIRVDGVTYDHDLIIDRGKMSALAQWLVRWKPIQLHRAVLAGLEGPAGLQLTLFTGQS